MKKKYWPTITAALILSASLAACGSVQQAADNAPAPQSEPPQTESSTAANAESTVSKPDAVQSTAPTPEAEPDHSKAYAAYLDILQENKDRIAAYDWQNEIWTDDNFSYGPVSPAALADVYGDETPELLFMRTPASDSAYTFEADLVVCTYEDESAKTLYDDRLDLQVAGGTCFCVFTGKDKSLYIYDSIGDEGVEYNYRRLVASDGAMTVTEKLKHTSYPNDNYDAFVDTYYKDDAEISKEEYETVKSAYFSSIDRILLEGDNDDEFLVPYAKEHGTDAMSYDDAVAKLRALAPGAGDASTAPSGDAPAQDTEAGAVFGKLNGLTMAYASGVGGWSSDLTFGENGTFTGSYHDSDMGDTGNGYPNGTIYVCEYSGKFEIANIINSSSYTLKLTEVATKNAPGEEWIEDDVRYIASDPYGISCGDEFILYLPGTPTADLTEDGLKWYTMPRAIGEGEEPATLPCFGLYNVNEGSAFYS